LNVGYCTNIHSGESLDEILVNLERYTLPVKRSVSPDQPMGVGLWFSAKAVTETLHGERWRELKDCLDQHDLVPHTFNAFPYADFHEPVVKQKVYRPDWTTDERVEYTSNVIRLMERLLPSGSHGTLSTLPIGWPDEEGPSPAMFQQAQGNFLKCVQEMVAVADRSQVHLRLCIEPEPGCALQVSSQVIDFMNWYLLNDENGGETNRRHLGVCHDVCHASVMFERQTEVLNRYREANVPIGKVQLSSALETVFDESREANVAKLRALGDFVEPRYLHQTCIKSSRPPLHYFDDLNMAIQVQQHEHYQGKCRTHFHVPVHLQTIGKMQTTQPDLIECLDWFKENDYPTQFEVETYAWQVSPESIQGGSLVESLIAELSWVGKHL